MKQPNQTINNKYEVQGTIPSEEKCHWKKSKERRY